MEAREPLSSISPDTENSWSASLELYWNRTGNGIGLFGRDRIAVDFLNGGEKGKTAGSPLTLQQEVRRPPGGTAVLVHCHAIFSVFGAGERVVSPRQLLRQSSDKEASFGLSHRISSVNGRD